MNELKIIFVGIIEENHHTMNTLKGLLTSFDYVFLYSNAKNNIFYLYKNETIIVVNKMKANELQFFEEYGIEFNFLIVNNIDFKSDGKTLFRNQFKKCQYYIINSDGNNLSMLTKELLDGIVITYGFNSKATMTISSNVIEQNMEASLCLQRDILTLSGERIVPFEFIVEIGSHDKDYIYSVLAVSIFTLLLGENIHFKNNLKIELQ